jgi:hypothetical protein
MHKLALIISLAAIATAATILAQVFSKALAQEHRHPAQDEANPDGRNHLCAPPPTATAYPPDSVFCFALGGGT